MMGSCQMYEMGLHFLRPAGNQEFIGTTTRFGTRGRSRADQLALTLWVVNCRSGKKWNEGMPWMEYMLLEGV